MRWQRGQPIFQNRYDAGQRLAEELSGYKGQSTIVLAIPNGGVPVGLKVALALDAEMDLVITRKLPLPLNPEAGFGAVADDGTAILNEEMVQSVGLTEHQINYQINRVRAEIRQRNLAYRRNRPPVSVAGKTVIIVDDGLASGFTMVASAESVKRRQPERIIAAVPTASITALARVEKVVDKVVTLAKGGIPFAVADFYRYWYDVREEEVFNCLKEWRLRRSKADIELDRPGSA
jgi:predicted phosphoribosyltransferase